MNHFFLDNDKKNNLTVLNDSLTFNMMKQMVSKSAVI